MKLLIENWRKYLFEDESQHFPWMDELKANPRIFINSQLDKRNRIGSGAFRFTVSPEGDPDYVIKFCKFRDSYFMNKVEKLLGEEYPEVFPRTYAAAEDYEWIVTDKVVPLHKGNQELLEEAMVATFPELYEHVSSLEIASGQDPMTIFGLIVDSIQAKNEIYDFATQNTDWFNQLLKSIHRYGVDPDDIAEGNIGLDTKTHTLKVLDASVFSKFGGEKDWNS